MWFGGDAPIAASSLLELTMHYEPEATGEILLGFAGVGTGRVYVNGELLHEDTVEAVGTDLGAAFLAPPSSSVPVHVVAGQPIDLKYEWDILQGGPLSGALAVTKGIEPDLSDPEGLIAEAVEAARAADVAVVVVGTNSRVESEGYDRTSLDLPGSAGRSGPGRRRGEPAHGGRGEFRLAGAAAVAQ